MEFRSSRKKEESKNLHKMYFYALVYPAKHAKQVSLRLLMLLNSLILTTFSSFVVAFNKNFSSTNIFDTNFSSYHF